MPVLDQTLEELRQRKQLADFYRERIDRQPLTGYVIDHTMAFVYVNRLSEDGEPDGISILRRDDLTRVRWGGRELESLQRLGDARSLVQVSPELELENLPGVLRSVADHFGHVGLMLEGIDPVPVYIGTLEAMDEEHVVLDTFGTLGRLDRSRMLFWLEDITRIDAGGKYEAGLVFLHEQDEGWPPPGGGGEA